MYAYHYINLIYGGVIMDPEEPKPKKTFTELRATQVVS